MVQTPRMDQCIGSAHGLCPGTRGTGHGLSHVAHACRGRVNRKNTPRASTNGTVYLHLRWAIWDVFLVALPVQSHSWMDLGCSGSVGPHGTYLGGSDGAPPARKVEADGWGASIPNSGERPTEVGQNSIPGGHMELGSVKRPIQWSSWAPRLPPSSAPLCDSW